MSGIRLRGASIEPSEVSGTAAAVSANPRPDPRRFRKLLACLALLLLAIIAGTILIQAVSTRELQITAMTSTAALSKWNPSFWFANLDEPLPSPAYRPGDAHRMLRWQLRNPFHNFTFYIIGIADKNFTRAGRYPDQVFNPSDGWNWAVCKYKWMRLPFLSFKNGGFCAYFGWRERGNFGITLRYHRDEPKTNPPARKA